MAKASKCRKLVHHRVQCLYRCGSSCLNPNHGVISEIAWDLHGSMTHKKSSTVRMISKHHSFSPHLGRSCIEIQRLEIIITGLIVVEEPNSLRTIWVIPFYPNGHRAQVSIEQGLQWPLPFLGQPRYLRVLPLMYWPSKPSAVQRVRAIEDSDIVRYI